MVSASSELRRNPGQRSGRQTSGPVNVLVNRNNIKPRSKRRWSHSQKLIKNGRCDETVYGVGRGDFASDEDNWPFDSAGYRDDQPAKPVRVKFVRCALCLDKKRMVCVVLRMSS